MDDAAPYPRFLSRGRAYAYVLPCRHEDVLKVGFTRDPIARLHALHRRWFEFFDLDRALLVEVDKVAQARRIERRFIGALVELRAPAPLVVRRLAGGHTEWYRGAGPDVAALLPDLIASVDGVLHAPLHGWLHAHFASFSDRLWQWSLKLLEANEYETHNLPPEARSGIAAHALRDALDSFDALGFELPQLLPPSVLRWYRDAPLFE